MFGIVSINGMMPFSEVRSAVTIHIDAYEQNTRDNVTVVVLGNKFIAQKFADSFGKGRVVNSCLDEQASTHTE